MNAAKIDIELNQGHYTESQLSAMASGLLNRIESPGYDGRVSLATGACVATIRSSFDSAWNKATDAERVGLLCKAATGLIEQARAISDTKSRKRKFTITAGYF